MITDKYDFPDKTLVTNVPFLKGELDIRDYVQEVVDLEEFNELIVITDSVTMYENIPVSNLTVMDLYDLLDKVNHRNVADLVDNEDTFILIKLYGEAPTRAIQALNHMIRKTRSFVLIVSDYDQTEIRHEAKFDLEEDTYIDESLSAQFGHDVRQINVEDDFGLFNHFQDFDYE